MERNLLLREIDSNLNIEVKPAWKWTRPNHDYHASDLNDLKKLILSVPLLAPYYKLALSKKFDLKIWVKNREEYYRLGGSKDSGGYTDKKKAEAYLVSFFDNGKSTINSALHEAIHLLSSPLKASNPNQAYFAGIFGSKLYEALTQYYTIVSMKQAGFVSWDDGKTYIDARKKNLVPFYKIFAELGITVAERDKILRGLYFSNNFSQFQESCKNAIKRICKRPITEPQLNKYFIGIYKCLRGANEALLIRARLQIKLIKQINEHESDLYEIQYNAPPANSIFYEDVVVKANETILTLAAAYGYDPDNWREIWNDTRNADLVRRRKTSDSIQVGDKLYIPIRWDIIKKKLEPSGNTFTLTAQRNGKEGNRLSWVQTVYGHNQPLHNQAPLPAFSVDWPDDDNPFYWTQAEIDANVGFPILISDTPGRKAPSEAMGATKWRAVTSLCVTTGKRVSIWGTFVWGINFMPDKTSTKYDIRPATKEEIAGHLNLLRKKVGKSKRSFQSMGWTFRDMNTIILPPLVL